MSSLKFRTLVELCRASNLPTVWMNVLTAAVLSNGLPVTGTATTIIIVLAIALSCFYCGGMALNDLYDLEYDCIHQPYRPLPAGRITIGQARLTMSLLFAAGLGGLLPASHQSGFLAGLLLLTAIWIYDRYHKRYPATVLVMASARLLVYVVSALALTGTVASAVWLAGGLQATYVLMLTVVARFESLNVARRYSFPVIPCMIAAMPIIDGGVLAFYVGVGWLLVAIIAAGMTRLGQRYVRGD